MENKNEKLIKTSLTHVTGGLIDVTVYDIETKGIVSIVDFEKGFVKIAVPILDKNAKFPNTFSKLKSAIYEPSLDDLDDFELLKRAKEIIDVLVDRSNDNKYEEHEVDDYIYELDINITDAIKSLEDFN